MMRATVRQEPVVRETADDTRPITSPAWADVLARITRDAGTRARVYVTTFDTKADGE